MLFLDDQDGKRLCVDLLTYLLILYSQINALPIRK